MKKKLGGGGDDISITRANYRKMDKSYKNTSHQILKVKLFLLVIVNSFLPLKY